ncbi:MAG TPA: hypothetical protein DDZ68_15895 [Parvularcula sp.]|nr:hypothetical protein [Parvularcula sp.]
MTKRVDGIIGCSALNPGDGDLMKLDPFDGASWKEKLSDQGPDGTVTVTLSTGKQVTVNSRLLALLRLLADELSREETKLH